MDQKNKQTTKEVYTKLHATQDFPLPYSVTGLGLSYETYSGGNYAM